MISYCVDVSGRLRGLEMRVLLDVGVRTLTRLLKRGQSPVEEGRNGGLCVLKEKRR